MYRICVECVLLSQANNTIKKSRGLFFQTSRSASQPHIQCTTAQQQQFNGSRVLSSCLCDGSHGVICVWLVYSRRSNDDNMITSNATIEHK